MKYNTKRAKLEKARKLLRKALGNVMLSEEYAVGFRGRVKEIRVDLDILINQMDYTIDNELENNKDII